MDIFPSVPQNSEADDVCSVLEVAIDTPAHHSRREQDTTAATVSPGGHHEDLSLPLSIDSGLDLTADCRVSC